MIVKLVRNLEVDLNNMPSDFEEQVQQCFSKFTEGTNSDYMFHDKLLFIDNMTHSLHGDKDAGNAVNDLMHEELDFAIENGEVRDVGKYYLSTDFMETCYAKGKESMELYSYEWREMGAYDKIMRLLCRAIKAVMDYKCGEDGVE